MKILALNPIRVETYSYSNSGEKITIDIGLLPGWDDKLINKIKKENLKVGDTIKFSEKPPENGIFCLLNFKDD